MFLNVFEINLAYEIYNRIMKELLKKAKQLWKYLQLKLILIVRIDISVIRKLKTLTGTLLP